METLKIEGVITKIMPTEQLTETFKKRNFVLETDEKYPQKIKFELTQNNTELVNDIKKQVNAVVYFNVRGREYTSKQTNKIDYFVSLNVWKVETSPLTPEVPEEIKAAKTLPEATTGAALSNDDLPF